MNRKIRTLTAAGLFLALGGCVSYYDGYDNYGYSGAYVTPSSYYQLPSGGSLGFSGLSYQDFYMLDNYPGDYFDAQLWGAVNCLTRAGIHQMFQLLY